MMRTEKNMTYKKKIIIMIFFSIILLCVYLKFSLYDNGPYRDPEYRIAIAKVLNHDFIGLSYDEINSLLNNPPEFANGELHDIQGVISKIPKSIRYSSVARFYICNTLNFDILHNIDYCYVVYFDENNIAVYVKIEKDIRGGL